MSCAGRSARTGNCAIAEPADVNLPYVSFVMRMYTLSGLLRSDTGSRALQPFHSVYAAVEGQAGTQTFFYVDGRRAVIVGGKGGGKGL